MTEFSFPKTFSSGTLAKSGEVNENFDKAEAALNSMFQAARVSASSALSVGSSVADVVGATVTITLTQASLVLVHTTFDFDFRVTSGSISGSSEAKGGCIGYLNVDGSDQSQQAEMLANLVSSDGQVYYPKQQACVGQSYILSLAAGAHTLKLRAKTLTEGGESAILVSVAKAWNPHTGFSYLVIPNYAP